MQITGLGRPSAVSFSAATTPTPVSRASFASIDGQAWIRLASEAEGLRSDVIDLRRMLSRIDPRRYVGGSTETRIEVGTASVSSPTLGIDFIGSNATRRSTAAINSDPPLYGPVTGQWQNGTTAAATVSGRYTGDTAETYTFRVDRVRPDSTRVDVYDSSGSRVRRLNLDATNYGEPLNVQEGLTVAIGSGSFVTGDSFTISAAPQPPPPIDPTATFDTPGYFDEGVSISAGSFTVNGTTIAVAADDTLDAVMARITAQTDVEATFDATNQHVVLTRKSAGDLPLDIGNDTSGFLEAFQLEKSKLVKGGDADPDTRLKDVAAFAPISSGTISVNGTGVAIDRNVHSLNDVLGAINASGAGVHASIVGGKVTLTSLTQGDAIVLADGGTAFFATLGLPTGTTEAPTTTITSGSRRRPAGASGATARDLATATLALGERLERIFSTEIEGTVAKAAIDRIANQSRKLTVKAFGIQDASETFRVGGLHFDLRAGATSLFDTSSNGRTALTKALTADIRAFHEGMMSEIGSSGKSFLDELESMADQLFAQARGNIDLRL